MRSSLTVSGYLDFNSTSRAVGPTLATQFNVPVIVPTAAPDATMQFDDAPEAVICSFDLHKDGLPMR